MRPKTLLVLSLILAVTGSSRLLPAQNLSEGEILGQAEARLRKYRTGDAHLRLAGVDGKPLRKGIGVRIEQTRGRGIVRSARSGRVLEFEFLTSTPHQFTLSFALSHVREELK
jgi:hypothetical protein